MAIAQRKCDNPVTTIAPRNSGKDAASRPGDNRSGKAAFGGALAATAKTKIDFALVNAPSEF
jgi:hypothetical protein